MGACQTVPYLHVSLKLHESTPVQSLLAASSLAGVTSERTALWANGSSTSLGESPAAIRQNLMCSRHDSP